MRQLDVDVADYRNLGGLWEKADYADFMCLQYPVYLPILEEIAASGDEKGADGHCPYSPPEAIEALLVFVKNPNRAFASC